MTEDFKKFIEEKSGCTQAAMCAMIAEPEGVNAKAILWDVMCAVNRKGTCRIIHDVGAFFVSIDSSFYNF